MATEIKETEPIMFSEPQQNEKKLERDTGQWHCQTSGHIYKKQRGHPSYFQYINMTTA